MIAANANTVINSLAFNKDIKIIAYAAANQILILDPYHINGHVPKVLFSLKGHQERVNGVQWLNTNTLVSISSDKSLRLWSFTTGTDYKNPLNWTYKRSYDGAHDQSINYLKAYSPNENENYIITMCSAGTLKLWQGPNIANIEYKDQLLFGKNLQEAVGLVTVGEKHLMLVVGGYDINIHVYLIPRLQHQGQKIFKYKFSLLGHQNAIRNFDFSEEIDKNVKYMASCSQDTYIRIWKIQPLENISHSMGGHDDLKQYESKTSFVLQDDDEPKVYNITLESVLATHQEAVSSVKWGNRIGQQVEQSKKTLQDFCLLSSSFDFTVCVWKADLETGVWSVESTLGAMQGNKHAYFGALFLQDDLEIIAFTFNGALHQWKKSSEGGKWVPQLTVKGHFGEVSDLDWDQHQVSLISCSQDQTTRLFSKYGNDNGWFEIARPQVHGYDMNTLATLPVTSTMNLPSKILSGGDEKVLRLFESPFSYVKIFNQLHPEAQEVNLRFSEANTNQEIEQLIGSEVKKQPLGLMNKPVLVLANQKQRVDEEEGGGIGLDFDPNKILSNTKDKVDEVIEDLVEPPVEDVLMSKTLWPEQQKLYGHAFEVFCVATSHNGQYAASASKAKDKKYADIIIWDLRKGQTSVPCCKLSAHNLTVVQMEFSKCDNYLLSCSRDRSWALFQRTTSSEVSNLQFSLIKKVKDAHSRIIWGLSWSNDDTLFVTASREKQKSVKVWHGINTSEVGSPHSELPEGENPSATAVRFFPNKVRGCEALIVGLETGNINVWIIESEKWVRIFQFPEYYAHCDAVRRIKFNSRYSKKTSENETFMVATCANDHSVRLFNLKF